MIRVKQLIERLSVFDPDLEVITAKDEEGNGFNEIYADYIGTSNYDGDGLANDEDIGGEDGYYPGDFRKVVVI